MRVCCLTCIAWLPSALRHSAGAARRVLAARTALLGAGAAPLLVIGPQPLRRVLAAVHRLEPMAFCFVESSCTTAASWSQVMTAKT